MLPDSRDPAFVGALVYFDKAAQRLSFAEAAKDLGVTPSAVSHRIAALERALGKFLFERETRRVRLTRDGAELAEVTRRAFGDLREIAGRLAARRVLRVSVGPYFSSTWLMPQLGAFERIAPYARIDLVHVTGAVDLRTVDVSIAWTDAQTASEAGRLLVETHCLPVMAPHLVGAQAFWDTTVPPIHYRDRRSWRHWLQQSGGPAAYAERGEILNDSALVLEVAAHGRGVALGYLPFVADMIKQGRLAPASQSVVRSERSFWVILADRRDPLSIQFETWLLGAARSQAAEDVVVDLSDFR